MGSLFYLRLIGFTAGTLLQLFWMVVILGYRRQRNFERVFFFLCLSLFLFYSGSLLALNAQIYYAQAPLLLVTFAWTILCTGLLFLPPLLVHLHLEYAETRALTSNRAQKRMWLAAMYAPVLYFGLRAYPIVVSGQAFDFLTPSYSFGRAFELWFAAALWGSAYWEQRFVKASPDERQTFFHRIVCGILLVAGLIFLTRLPGYAAPDQAWISAALVFLPILPLAALIYYVQRFNFLQIGRQQNLLFAVSVTFFALLYLSLVRRVGIWLEPILPPEASAAILLFVLVVFIEPLQRVLGRRLRETAQQEMEQAQRIAAVIQQVARQGNQTKLISFTEEWLKGKLELADARILLSGADGFMEGAEGKSESCWDFPIERTGQRIGALRVRAHGAMLSGETRAALGFLCEQLPGALDLCRLIEEKLQLERELAERERLAVLGQMAASISHNLKNPLGSIKTILQVQLESAELPESIRGETKMVLEEIGRLSSKLNQLLQFSRPAVRGGVVSATCDARAVAEEVSGVLRHEAERRGVALEVVVEDGGTKLAASSEAVNEILSNLVVNALEATARGGHVKVSGRANGDAFLFAVEDDGPGIPESVRGKILQPFFTTKTQGTGLGLAIVARRVAEFGGTLDWESPVKDANGTRFEVVMPMKDRSK
ncbi:MAG: ATP-binding protein [Candidatus Acidiferrum sp.]